MDDSNYSQFFSQPSHPYQRQYEALRAVFLDGLSQKQVAQQFGYDYDSFRQLVCQFRAQIDADGPSPFFAMSRSEDHERNPPSR